MRRGPFFLIFAVSGAAALIYEIVWTRLLTLHMGHGIAAASTVLAAFMGGLAAGAALAGPASARRTPEEGLATYARLELGIGFLALLVPFGLLAFQPILASTYGEGQGGALFGALRLLLSLLLVAIPASAMGATFPFAARWTVRHASSAARDAGFIYAANTIGAALGAVAAGFVLIPTLGLRGTTWVGVGLNLVAASGAVAILRSATGRPLSVSHAPAVAPNRAGRTAPTRAAGEVRPAFPLVALVAVAATGLASLTLQIVWTRLLAMILGPTTYAFSTIVAVFILGIAGGSTIGARLAQRMRQPVVGLTWCLLGSMAGSLVAAAAVDWSLLAMAHVVADPGVTFAASLRGGALLVAGLLLPMALAFGAAFPFAVALMSTDDDSVTEGIGRIYSVNTVGAIAGALLAGFVLLPTVGLHLMIRGLAVGLAAGAATMALVAVPAGRARFIALGGAVAVALAAIALPPWDRLLLSSGAYKYAPALQGPSLETALAAGELLSYREGAAGTVSVRQLAGTRSLAIDGKVDASNSGDMLTQRLLAHVPLLLHPNPRRAAIIGLGSGVTLGAALTHPLTEVVVLEISPEVVDASRFFETENHRALADPRTRLVVGDGRTHLQLSRSQYDVIVSEPSNPWMAGIASLFTREFFEAARARLAPGGVLCQWAHTYDISSADLRSIVATFSSVFPDGALLLVGDADILLVGSDGPLDARFAGLGAAWARPGVAADLALVGATTPFDVSTLFIARGPALAAWASGARIQTDDHAPLEFSGPRAIVGREREDNAQALRTLGGQSAPPEAVRAALAGASAADWRHRGAMLLRADAPRPAYDDFARALERDPSDAGALDGLVRAAGAMNQLATARALLTGLAADPSHRLAQIALSRVLAAEGAIGDAIRIPFTLLQASPGDVPALEQLASILSDAGDAERLAPVVARLLGDAPTNPWSHYYAAALAFLRSQPHEAIREARLTLGIDPGHAKAQNLIGAALASLGQTEPARAAFLASLQADPREAGTYANLATLEMQAGNRDRAIRYFSEALTIDPASDGARRGLAEATARH